MKKKAILSLFLTVLFSSAMAQKVAIIGARHLNSTEDGAAILALDDLNAGEVYYFTDNNYDHPSDAFIYSLDGGGSPIKEGVVKITIISAVTKGNVIYFKEIAPSSSNTYTFAVTPGTGTVSVQHVSSSGSFSIADFGESLYIYTDNDEDPANGITEIHGAFFAGLLTNSTNFSGGPMPATENPIYDYPNAVIVHNFPQYDYNLTAYINGVDRVEFNVSTLDRTDITRIELENPANYVYFGNDQDLSTTKFTNFNLTNSNPVVTLTRDFSQLAENSSSNFNYTFTVDTTPLSDLVINFSLNGSSTFGIANFGSDFTQTGATTMNQTAGTVTISSGTTSKTIIINPTGDSGLEPDESFQLAITPGAGYTAGSPSVAGSVILNDDALDVVPEVAIVGTRHYTDNEDGVSEFSFVALKDLTQGDAYFFSSNPFNKSTLLFEDYSTFPSAMKWFVPTGGVNRGDVMVVKKTGPNTFVLTHNGSSTSAGSISKVSPAKKFYISPLSGYFRAHTDTDDNPFNGIEAIHSQVFTYEVTQGFGGNMPTTLDLSTLYPSSVLIDGFPNSSPGRLEYDPTLRPITSVDQSNFENPSNWLYAQPMQDLSPVPFGNIIVSEGSVNPKATVAVSTSEILEDSETAVFTFTLDALASSDITINFSVAGTAAYLSDYTVTGSSSFSGTNGSIIILNGTSSSQLTLTPVGDSQLEKTETVLLTLTAGSAYDGGSPGNAELDILNDDADSALPQLAIIGINHELPESMSLVAVNAISPNTTFYLTPGGLDKANLTFSGNAKFKFISGDNCLPAGTVFTITGGIGGPLTVNCNGTSGAAACGATTILNHVFSFLDIGTKYYVFQDNDEDQTNGFTQIHSVFHSGGSYPSNHTGGTLQPEENPESIYSNAIVIDGFPASQPNRTEFDPSKRAVNVSETELENVSNYLHGQVNAALSGLNFDIIPLPLNLVTNTNDDGCGSLRYAISHASSGDTIRFEPTINGDSIKLSTVQILIDKNLTIIGNGKDSSIIDRQGLGRIFEVAANVTLNLDSIRLQNGDVRSNSGVAGQGGAIFVNGRLYISNSHFQGNKAVVGGALMGPASGTADIFIDKSTFSSNLSNTLGGAIGFGSDTLFILNSTFLANSSLDDAGVIRSINAGKVLLISSTFSGNSASSLAGLGGVMRENGSSVEVDGCTFYNNTGQQGGAFHLETNNFSIQNSILKNSASDIGQDINVPGGYVLTDLGHNLVYSSDGNHSIIDGNGIDPKLEVLADNGGPTFTHALICGSSAVDAGTGTLADQRGIPVFNGVKDIGAYEFQEVYDPLLVTNTNDNGCGSLRFIVSNAAAGDTIRFDQAIDGDTIKLISGQILINKNLVIIGNDSTKTIIDGQASSRIFGITSSGSIVISLLTIQNGGGVSTGGGILNNGGLNIIKCQITNNTTIHTTNHGNFTLGGGISNIGPSAKLKIRNSQITRNCTNNSSGSNGFAKGGGIYNNGNGASVEIFNSKIAGNKVVNSNTATSFINASGGGISNEGIGAVVSLFNSQISGNSAIGNNSLVFCRGGGISNEYYGQIGLKNCSIAGNSVNATFTSLKKGGGIFLINATLSIQNSIVTKNDIEDILKESSASITNQGNNLVEKTNGNHGITDGNGIDPLFIQNVPTAPTVEGNLRLQACSLGINAGTPDTTGLNLGLIDLAGNPRIIGGRIDIGAYERTTTPLEITHRTLAEFNEQFACENSSVKLPAGLSSPDFTYQWQIDQGSGFSNLTEASPYSQTNGDTLLISPIVLGLDGYRYRAHIAEGCGGNIISDTITLRVGELPVLVTSPLTQEVCPGNEVVLEAAFTGAGFSYLWQVDEGSGFVNVSGSDYTFIGNKLLISNFDYAKNNNQYRALAKSTCFEVPSDVATITINTDVTILAQPTGQTVCEFSTAIFTAQVVKLTPGSLNYQWQRKTGIGTWVDINTGGRYVINGNQLQITNAPASWNGAEFRCLMNDYCQTIPKTLNVIPVAHVTQNPANQAICVGNNANFSISATGQGITYRWQVNAGMGFVNLTDGGIYQGATSANLSLSFPTAAVNNYQYRCVVSGTSTCDLVSDTSAVASISVGVSAEAQTVFYNSPITTDDGVTQAVAYILGINKILQPNGKAEYRAGNSILLNPGFEVEAGAVFSARIINPCMSVSTSSAGGGSVPKEVVK